MYILSYFRTEAEALHLAISEDGMQWRALNDNQPILRGTHGSGALRDPFVMRAQDGRFHLLATGGWAGTHIVHAVSDDLLHWSPQECVPVMAHVPIVRNCWAPECFYDHGEQVYRLLWSSSISAKNGENDWNHRIWGATTRDFLTYTQAQVFFDPGYSVIDATVAYDDGVYLLAFKDERGENAVGTDNKAIRVAASRSGAGPWDKISGLVTPPLTEGPTLFRNGGRWIMLYDHFMENHFGASARDDGRNWTSLTERMRFPDGLRHASVLEVDGATAQDLRIL